MSAPIELVSRPYLESRPSHREMRIRFASREALVAGLARARGEDWVEDARLEAESLELVITLAGGFHRSATEPAPRLH